MKKNIKTIMLGLFTAVLATGCVGDDDYKLAPFDEPAWSEGFQDAVDGTTLDLPGWTNFNETGRKKWNEEVFTGNGYAEFSTFGSGDPVNVGWLITPAVNIDGTSKVLTFQTAQHHLEVPANKIEVLVSSNYDGTNVLAATWTPLTATFPTAATDWYLFVSSGRISLAAYSGNVHIAFKVTGSGTDLTLDGAYQIDNVKILK
ncbi:choice-of-anchor J domain-containing protein [Flavobacterium rivuli]|uniref:choice-of-anchor J domain-containing protein n=1 Tax=Flavobacterium rivuli TaxID=498301 RepID=UPI00037C8BFF|nr:choice-of-anchor J domain-containing protein [Flavobacterium rivuli]